MFRAWLPIPTLTKTITLFFIISAIFMGIGIPMIILSNQIIEVTVDYDSTCKTNNCTVSFSIPQAMQAPIFVYYELDNYYQNHRMYANSVSQKQLVGDIETYTDVFILSFRSQLFVIQLLQMLIFIRTYLLTGLNLIPARLQILVESLPTLSLTIPIIFFTLILQALLSRLIILPGQVMLLDTRSVMQACNG